jgi:tetratricopeptide (TPR) repeat protein
VAWFFCGLTLTKLRRLRDALKCLSEAERQGHLTSLVYETQGDAHYNLKEYSRARQNYDRALHRNAGNPLLESKLGLAVVRAGNVERGLRLVQQAVESKPGAGELHDRLILSLVWLDRIKEAGAAAETKLKMVEHAEAGGFPAGGEPMGKTEGLGASGFRVAGRAATASERHYAGAQLV